MIKVAIMGHGVVGSGVALLLKDNRKTIENATNTTIELKKVLDLKDFSECGYSDIFTKQFSDIKDDDEIKIVVETIGGLTPAYEFTKELLKSKKSVITSNKELVASKGYELIKLAKGNGVNYMFEASVGGGMPIVYPLSKCLSANKIKSITGILNGTTNFILDRMEKDNMDFKRAIKLAKLQGYAEADPTSDIEGDDSARKIAILSSIASAKHIFPSKVKKEGIKHVTKCDVQYAKSEGYVIKLISYATIKDNTTVDAMVSPCFIPKSNILASVNGVNSGAIVNGNFVGDVFFMGEGAGKEATASAVVADIINCALAGDKFITPYWEKKDDDTENLLKTVKYKFYIRLECKFGKTQIKRIKEELNKVKFLEPISKGEIAIITKKITEKDLDSKLRNLKEKGIKKLIKLKVLN